MGIPLSNSMLKESLSSRATPRSKEREAKKAYMAQAMKEGEEQPVNDAVSSTDVSQQTPFP